MVAIKKQDFVEIEYTGSLKEEEFIFDTTDEKIAKENGIFNKGHKYGPIKIMVGNSQVLPGLDRFMEGKEPGEYSVNIEAIEGFGRKDAKLLRLIPKKIFIKQKINPMPGLPIETDNLSGVIKTVSGGRCIVDFNHPLSGKNLKYNLKINKIITDEKEKVESIVDLQLKKENYEVQVENQIATITTTKITLKKPLKDLIEDMVKKFTKIEMVTFKEEPSKKV